MDRSIAGPGLVGAGLRGMLNVASVPLKKGVKAVTSTISAIDDLTKKREENRKKRDAANDALRKVPDDPRLPNIEKDPEVEMHDRRPPDKSTPKDTSPEFQDTMRGLGRGKNLDPETKLERIRKATDDFKKWQKSNKPKN